MSDHHPADDPERNSVWEYKNIKYVVEHTSRTTMIQDPETGEWGPSVLYGVYRSTQNLCFARAMTEFKRKFVLVAR